MHRRSSFTVEYSVVLGWGNDKTPFSESSIADHVARRYCTTRRHECIVEYGAHQIQRYAEIVLREREQYSRAANERAGAERSTAYMNTGGLIEMPNI